MDQEHRAGDEPPTVPSPRHNLVCALRGESAQGVLHGGSRKRISGRKDVNAMRDVSNHDTSRVLLIAVCCTQDYFRDPTEPS